MDEQARLILGDCRTALQKLDAESVQCVVTSPPYWGLRDYGVDGQLGLEPTPEAYVANLVAVFREVRRVLRPDGVVFLNLGDSYMSSGPRQTGRNDTDRPTPGGRGGSFRGGVRRVISYGTSDKAPEGYQDRGCLCESLCDACRVAYQTGRAHSDCQRVPTLSVSPYAPTPEHKVSGNGHSPTLDSGNQEAHIASASLDLGHGLDHGGEQPHASLQSTNLESSQLPQESRWQVSIQDAKCLLCGRSLTGSAPVSERKTACPSCSRTSGSAREDRCPGIDGTVGIGDSSADHRSGMAYGLAYPDYTTTGHQPQLKPKDLVGIPWRVAFALQADGWWLRSDIIWHKPNPMPESVTDRPTKAHEYVFLLTKNQRYFYDADAVRESFADERQGCDGAKIERIRNVGGRTDGYTTPNGWNNPFGNSGRNRRTVWSIATEPYKGAHFATMPTKLVEPCILAGSKPGDVVLDPFAGSGTVGVVALRHGRQFIGIELNPAYIALAQERLAQVQMRLTAPEPTTHMATVSARRGAVGAPATDEPGMVAANTRQMQDRLEVGIR